MKLTSVQRGCVISDFWALQHTRLYIEVFKDDSCVFHCVFRYSEEAYRHTPCLSGMPLVNMQCYMYMVKPLSKLLLNLHPPCKKLQSAQTVHVLWLIWISVVNLCRGYVVSYITIHACAWR